MDETVEDNSDFFPEEVMELWNWNPEEEALGENKQRNLGRINQRQRYDYEMPENKNFSSD